MLIKISLIAALGLLPLLFIGSKIPIVKRLALPLFIISVATHLGLSFINPEPMSLKFLGLFKSLAALSVVSIVFNALKANKIVQIGLYVALLVGLKFYFSGSAFTNSNADINVDDEYELLVRLKEGKNTTDLKEQVDRYGLNLTRAFTPLKSEETRLDDYYVVGIPDKNESELQEIFNSLNKDIDTDWIEYNEVVKLAPLVEEKVQRVSAPKIKLNDPLLKEQWGLSKTNVSSYYNWLTQNNIKPQKKARIAILDTGVDSKHEDLSDNYISIRRTHDNDPKGHGTLCAGVAAAVSNNGIGIASLVPNSDFVEVTSVKVLNSFGMGTQHKIIKGILEAADNQSDVISMSLGGPSSDSRQKAYNDAVAYANKQGAIVIVAAGNSNKNAAFFTPANVQGVIAVSALDENLNRASFSNTVEDIAMAVAAPGVNIHSTYPDNKYGSFSGTSFAAPYVSGLVGVMVSVKPGITTEEVYEVLSESGIVVEASAKTGNVISPKEALNRLVGETN